MSTRAANCTRARPLLVAAVALLLLTVVGCGREEPVPPPSGPIPQAERSEAVTVETELHYELVKTYPSGLTELKGIAIDGQGRIHLAGAEGIRVLDPQGELVASWRTSGPARCVALAEDGTVWVGLAAKVEAYDGSGKLVSSWGVEGSGRGELSVVTSVAVVGLNVFVADAGNRCIHRFDVTGDFIDEIGKRDRETDFVGLICPSPYLDFAVDADGVLHVTNPGRLRVERYQSDGELLGFWGKPGTRPEEFSGCCNPSNVALLGDGRVVTAEKRPPRVKVYDGQGTMLAYLGPEHFTSEAMGLDLAVDSSGRLHVIDPGDGKVRVFELRE